MLSRIVLFLGFLLHKEIILRTKTRPRWVQAFSRIPTVTRVERWRNFGIESYQHPRTTAGTSSSLNAWQMPFGSTKKSPTIGKDGLYHIATEQEYRYGFLAAAPVYEAQNHSILFCSTSNNKMTQSFSPLSHILNTLDYFIGC